MGAGRTESAPGALESRASSRWVQGARDAIGNLSGLADRVPVPVLVVDSDGVVVRSDDAARESLWDPASVGADVTNTVADVDRAVVKMLLSAVDDGENDAEGAADDDGAGEA